MRTASLTLACCVTLAAAASAQPVSRRGHVSVSGGVQPRPADLSDTIRFDLYSETATIDVDYPGKEGVVVDGGAGLRLWKQLGAGVAASYRTSTSRLSAAGSLPHPFYLDRGRAIEGETSGVARSETGVHVQALYFVPARGRWRVVLSAGPSFFNLEQELAEEVRYHEEYPYDTAEFRDAIVRRFTGTAVGFNAGADLTFLFTKHLGVGALVRFARASLDLDGPDDRRIAIDAGGLQAGAGVRIVF